MYIIFNDNSSGVLWSRSLSVRQCQAVGRERISSSNPLSSVNFSDPLRYYLLESVVLKRKMYSTNKWWSYWGPGSDDFKRIQTNDSSEEDSL